MAIISVRQFRDNSDEVIRGVERGETYTVVRRGVPVARLSPVIEQADLQCVRPATLTSSFAEIYRSRTTEPAAQLLDDVRGDR